MGGGIDDSAQTVHHGLDARAYQLGDGAAAYRDKLEGMLQVPWTIAPAHVNRQRAGAVAALAERYFAEGRIPAAEHRPEYLRLSQAERERAERERESGVQA